MLNAIFSYFKCDCPKNFHNRHLLPGNSKIPAKETTFVAGEYQGDSTELIYLRARYYNPQDGRFQSRDTWDGDFNQPITYNKWVYANANPMYYIDPSGNVAIPALALLAIQMAGGAIVGAAVGYGAGYLYGCATYESALTGKCGCDMQQQALSMSREDWKNYFAMSGAIAGAVFGAIGATGPAGLLIAGVLGAGLSLYDIYETYNIVMNETGLTLCTALRTLYAVAGVLLSIMAIRTGWKLWEKSGNPLKWDPLEQPENVNSQESLARQLYDITRPGNSPRTRESVGEDPLSWFYNTAESGSVRPHRNPAQALKGGLEGTLAEGGTIQYRPIVGPRSNGYPSIELQNVPGFPSRLIIHFLP